MHEIVKLDDNVERTYKLFRFQNLSPEEAVNLTALSVNLNPSPHWTLDEIKRILFIRDMVEKGKMGH
jgi:hypothetical protein